MRPYQDRIIWAQLQNCAGAHTIFFFFLVDNANYEDRLGLGALYLRTNIHDQFFCAHLLVHQQKGWVKVGVSHFTTNKSS